MKSVIIRKIPLLVTALLTGLAAALVNAFLSLRMMEAADFALAGNRDKVFETGIKIGRASWRERVLI